MATLNKAAFEAKYGSSGTIFPDNTTGDISEGDMRDFGQDIADSLYNVSVSGALTFLVIEIGDWNMDSAGTVTVNHGVADFKKIRSVDCIIRDDTDNFYYPIDFFDTGTETVQGGKLGISSTQISLARKTGGVFDSGSFDSTSFNRGWITISYTS
jgi:hypothetical protein